MSFFVISKEGNGPVFRKGDYAELCYEIRIACENPPEAKCKGCHEGTRPRDPAEKGVACVYIGDGQVHKFIDDALSSGQFRHGSAILFYLSAEDAFADVGADNRVGPNSAVCVRIEEVSFNSYDNNK